MDMLDFWILLFILFPIIFLWGLFKLMWFLLDYPWLFVVFSFSCVIFPSLLLGEGEIEISNIILHLLCIFVILVGMFLLPISINHLKGRKDNEENEEENLIDEIKNLRNYFKK